MAVVNTRAGSGREAAKFVGRTLRRAPGAMRRRRPRPRNGWPRAPTSSSRPVASASAVRCGRAERFYLAIVSGFILPRDLDEGRHAGGRGPSQRPPGRPQTTRPAGLSGGCRRGVDTRQWARADPGQLDRMLLRYPGDPMSNRERDPSRGRPEPGPTLD